MNFSGLGILILVTLKVKGSSHDVGGLRDPV